MKVVIKGLTQRARTKLPIDMLQSIEYSQYSETFNATISNTTRISVETINGIAYVFLISTVTQNIIVFHSNEYAYIEIN